MSQSGFYLLRTPKLNKGLVFTQEERSKLNLNGLLPPAINSLELECERAMKQLQSKSSPLEKYIFMQTLQDVNETLYYKLLVKHTAELMPIVYTPTVGQACLEYSAIYRQTPRGLYITLNHLGQVSSILDSWPEKDIRAIVFTDGERILGLGDLGANGLGIPVGKLALYTACAGVPPSCCLPVVLDVGTNNEQLLNDPLYIGVRARRDRGEKFAKLVDELMTSAKAKYGPNVLLQFEDFGNTTAFEMLRKYQSTHCTFNDDIQGTASVVLGGILAAIPVTRIPLQHQSFLFLGAGEAGTGIADLLAQAIARETGKSVHEARQQIWLVDSKGLVVASRKDSLQHHKLLYAHEIDECSTLEQAVDRLQPTALIGVCTIPKTFTRSVCEKMAKYQARPIIFALSNPTSKAECTAEEAYEYTDGKCIFASGSPFDPVMYNGKRYVPGQGNNSYIFPAIGLACVAVGLTHIDDGMMITAAEALAAQVTSSDLDSGCVYPPLSQIRKVSLKIAIAVADYGFAKGFASVEKPSDLEEHIRSTMYTP